MLQARMRFVYSLMMVCASGAAACGPPPSPPPVLPVVVPVAPPPKTATVAAAPPPQEVLPALHPCVPTFVQKELFACEAGVPAADYNAVANAMATLSAAGPQGPLRRPAKPIPRALSDEEEAAVTTARAFLCRAPEGDMDDEHATVAFDLGRTYLLADHLEEAVLFLRAVAILDPQKHAEVEYAARFLMDALRPLADARPECKPVLTAMTEALTQHVCSGPTADERKETCAVITGPKSP